MAGEMLTRLQAIVQQRQQQPREGSFTNSLFEAGIAKIAQKVGEEGVEVVVAALAQDDDHLLNEAADLLFMTTVLLVQRGLTWEQVEAVLRERHRPD